MKPAPRHCTIHYDQQTRTTQHCWMKRKRKMFHKKKLWPLMGQRKELVGNWYCAQMYRDERWISFKVIAQMIRSRNEGSEKRIWKYDGELWNSLRLAWKVHCRYMIKVLIHPQVLMNSPLKLHNIFPRIFQERNKFPCCLCRRHSENGNFPLCIVLICCLLLI